MSTPPRYLGRIRFRFGSHDVVATLFAPGTWHVEGVEGPLENVVRRTVQSQFDPRQRDQSLASGPYGTSKVTDAAAYFQGQAETPDYSGTPESEERIY